MTQLIRVVLRAVSKRSMRYVVMGITYFDKDDPTKHGKGSPPAINMIQPPDDQWRLRIADTFSAWLFWEAKRSSGASVMNNLIGRIRALESECESPIRRQQIANLYATPVDRPEAVD